MQKPLPVSQETAKFLNDGNTLSAFWETGIQFKKQQLEVDKEQ